MQPSGPLRSALLANAAFSSVCGLALLFAPGSIGDLLGLEANLIYRLLGAGLLLFAADLVHQATRPVVAQWRAALACAADFAWVAATALAFLFFPGALSEAGALAVLTVGLIVLGFGLWQAQGLKFLRSGS